MHGRVHSRSEGAAKWPSSPVAQACTQPGYTWSAPAEQKNHAPNHVIYTRVPKGSPLSPASKAGDTLTPSAARHSSKCRHRKPGPPSRSLTSTLPASTSTRFYSLATSTAIATSTSIFTTAPQTDHVPWRSVAGEYRKSASIPSRGEGSPIPWPGELGRGVWVPRVSGKRGARELEASELTIL